MRFLLLAALLVASPVLALDTGQRPSTVRDPSPNLNRPVVRTLDVPGGPGNVILGTKPLSDMLPGVAENGDMLLMPNRKLGRIEGGKYIGTMDGLEIAGRTKSTLPSLATTETTSGGSVGEGQLFTTGTRTSGFGQYGNVLHSYNVKAATPSGQFDVGHTTWVNHENLTGGQLFAAWWGANTPSSGNDYSGNALKQTYTGGAVIGGEINVGNRWGDFGLQEERGNRFTIGLQIVPDPIPASDGPTTAVYPGSYALMMSSARLGQRWWVGSFIPRLSLMPGGIGHLIWGGDNADGSDAPQSPVKAKGVFYFGYDVSEAKLTGGVLKLSTSSGGVVTGSDGKSYMKHVVDGAIKYQLLLNSLP